MKNANFIAIDFETATTSTRMPCQIGIVVVKEGQIVDRIQRYIQPPGNRYSAKCISIHGITPTITKDKPEFDIVWEEIKEYFEANFIVAHNINFDTDVLNKALNRYNIETPRIMGMECTFNLTGVSLDNVCKDLGIELDHHSALSDATACAEIFLRYLKGDIKIDHIYEKEENESSVQYQTDVILHEKINKEYLIQDLNVENKDNSFYNKKVVITGVFNKISRNDLAHLMQSLGADVNTSISKKTNYVITGMEPGPSKMQKIKGLQDEGCDINVISEDLLLEILEKEGILSMYASEMAIKKN